MSKIMVLNGPNLNLLGKREPEVYGTTTLDEINQALLADARSYGHELECFQSNAEHELVELVHSAQNNATDFIIINPGAFTHTSIALRDAFLGVAIPFIEVHLSNVFARESFRQHSFLSDIALGVISGMGAQGYNLALQVIDKQLRNSD
ncbi:MAG: type II 3-dehydroquinate dehydratase [Gammaproteobacteria bacterium]|nr:type II 3-dehydroquinate dehydratase [Gammaproteobacteria bacterium]